MKDRTFLAWIHERLELRHGDNAGFDFMHKLRSIIAATPEAQETANVAKWNSLEAMREELKIPARLNPWSKIFTESFV